MKYARWRDWLPDAATVSWPERLRAGAGGALAILLVGIVASSISSGLGAVLITASMGASAVIVFGLPTSPLGQPWPLLGGHLISAAIGVLCQWFIPVPQLAGALAVGLAIIAMLACRCAHPPGRATALTAVIGGPVIHQLGFAYLLHPILTGALAILVVGLLVNNLLLGRQYPLRKHLSSRHGVKDPEPLARGPVQESDITRAVAERDLLVDLTPAELEQLYISAERYAASRLTGGLCCGDIASRDVLVLSADILAEHAWRLLNGRAISSAPVVDGQARVIGLFSPTAMLQDAPTLALAHDALSRLQGKPVTEMMRLNPPLVSVNTPVADLLAQVSASEEHLTLVLDEAGGLYGVISQTDLIASLFHQQIFDTQSGSAGLQN
ncbi:HPP family protein [Chitinimonas sp. PSY-7]|uniref:HPP family protein n=1 Tax=Chitinimonas sp. PSY-7 TaxID=3459088 RepID=UPI00403FC9F6